MQWNLGDLLDHVGRVEPTSRPALIHGDRVLSWADVTRRSNNLARALQARGVGPGAKAAFYLRNVPEYMEFLLAALKGRLTHVNVNYRYRERELLYIFDNSDTEVVVYSAEFRDRVEQIRDQCPKVKAWVEVGDETPPAFAIAYETLAEEGDGAPLNIERNPHDPIFVYTGGTTGMPKGVIWTHHIIMSAQLNSLRALNGDAEPPASIPEFLEHVRARGMHVRQLPAAPLMHATGMTVAMGAMVSGGCVITLPTTTKFDAAELWREASRHGATSITIVGDAFAKPMLAALEEAKEPYKLDSVQSIVSSGVVWSTPVKQGLVKHIQQVLLLDSLGSTEAPACGATITTKDGEVTETLDFRVGPECRVFDEDDNEIEPGSGKIGFMARSGFIPIGYYKDEAKTRETFKTIGGVRYAIPGDLCHVEADGRLVLLGRRSSCINTGGEKVFAEEVEETLKAHPAVDDANVFGVPDEKWGQAVIAVIATRPGAGADEAELRAFVHERLAGYKTPKRIFTRPDLERHPNGKPNYERMRTYALGELERSA
jgi:3-oxocholest-4-en-26-oate---CoA ligase